MAQRKVLRIIFIQHLLFLSYIPKTVKCQNTEFSGFSESGKSYIASAGASNEMDLHTNCTLRVNDDSKHYFSSMILHYKYNFVYLKLEFNNFSIEESNDVIEYKRWVWTYKGEKGGYQNLFLPINLIWIHVIRFTLDTHVCWTNASETVQLRNM